MSVVHCTLHQYGTREKRLPFRMILAVLRIRDPVPYWPRDPGWVKNQDSDPEWTTRIISPSLETIFCVKILKFFVACPDSGSGIFWLGSQDPGWKKLDPGSGINIPDPQHGILARSERDFVRVRALLTRQRFVGVPYLTCLFSFLALLFGMYTKLFILPRRNYTTGFVGGSPHPHPPYLLSIRNSHSSSLL